MDPKKDPASDRKEFIERLDAIFCNLSDKEVKDYTTALIKKDTSTLESISNKVIYGDVKKDSYLSDYDAAPDYKGRQVVVGSVKP